MPEKGVPILKNYTPEQYENKGKVWEIASAPSGLVYMATGRGLLEFDGKNWKTFSGSTGITRSLLIENDSLIYSGSDLDFGVWKKNEYQDFEYRSLYPYKNEPQDFVEEFWDIHKVGDKVVFVSHQNIYVYQKGQLVRITAPGRISGSFSVDHTLYIADKKEGVFLFDGFKLKKIFDFPENFNSEISGLYPRGAELIIVTREKGLFAFSAGKLSKIGNFLSRQLENDKVFSFERIGNSYVAFGTVLHGLYIADMDGKIIHRVNRNKGLPVNTILSMHYGPDGKLWLGMDYGISVIHLNNPFTTFLDHGGNFGTAQTALLKNGSFYLGTNQGLYRSEWTELNNDASDFNFRLVPGTEGQVWAVEEIDNTLWLGHDKGLYIIRDNALELISEQEGVWTIIQYKNHILTGNYNGISIFKNDRGQWRFLKKMDLIYGSCNELIIEKDNILWVNIPSFGIIRAVLDSELNPVERLIFPEKMFSGYNTFIHKDPRGISVHSDDFTYLFDEKNKKFTKAVPAAEPEFPFLPIGKSRNLSSEYQFYPVHNGFMLYKINGREKLVSPAKISLVFRKTEAFDNNNRKNIAAGESIPHDLNNLRIDFIVPNRDNVLYQYKSGNSDKWSPWSSDNFFEFLNLTSGKFTFEVRAKIDGKISETKSVSFDLLPPWYRSAYAWILYFVGFVLLAFLLKKIHDISLKKQKKKLLIREQLALQKQAEQHKEDILVMEQLRLQGEYDLLKDQLKTKTVALAKKARENEEKNRLILTLKEKCELAQSNPNVARSKWREMHRLLETYLEMEDRTFEIQMDELHQEFFRKLKSRFSDLSNNDLRMCAYLKIGLNSKEVSEILNIQPSSFYISRSRLRKKLNLKPSENLFDFLNAI